MVNNQQAVELRSGVKRTTNQGDTNRYSGIPESLTGEAISSSRPRRQTVLPTKVQTSQKKVANKNSSAKAIGSLDAESPAKNDVVNEDFDHDETEGEDDDAYEPRKQRQIFTIKNRWLLTKNCVTIRPYGFVWVCLLANIN